MTMKLVTHLIALNSTPHTRWRDVISELSITFSYDVSLSWQRYREWIPIVNETDEQLILHFTTIYDIP